MDWPLNLIVFLSVRKFVWLWPTCLTSLLTAKTISRRKYNSRLSASPKYVWSEIFTGGYVGTAVKLKLSAGRKVVAVNHIGVRGWLSLCGGLKRSWGPPSEKLGVLQYWSQSANLLNFDSFFSLFFPPLLSISLGWNLGVHYWGKKFCLVTRMQTD